MYGTRTDIGGIVKTVDGISPQTASAGTVNGSAIDRTGFDSCVLRHACGAATGTPSTQSVTTKLQDSADGSTGWADISGAAAAALTANSTGAEQDVNLLGVRQFVRAVQTVAFTGGTSPAIPASAMLVLGGARNLPA